MMTLFRFPNIVRCLLGTLLAVGLIAPGLALADAVPVQLVLLYMPNVSNTGTPKASGIAEVLLQEGEVRIAGAGLPRLEEPSLYVAWVVNTETNEFQRIGDFNSAQTSGAVRYENVLPSAISDNKWNILLVTVEEDTSADHPSAQHSIAGVFPRAADAPLPGLLPNTGGLPDEAVVGGESWTTSWADRLPVAGLVALTFTLGLGAGYGMRKRRESASPLVIHHSPLRS